MAQHEEIIVWLDRRWKEAIEHHLKDETLRRRISCIPIWSIPAPAV